jgi:hypothetical protein
VFIFGNFVPMVPGEYVPSAFIGCYRAEEPVLLDTLMYRAEVT